MKVTTLDNQFTKYEEKLVQSGLAKPGDALFGFLDAELEWNRDAEARPVLERLFEKLSINSLLFCRPAEPYAGIIDYLAETPEGTIRPEDCETRTFLHDLPVASGLDADQICSLLRKRKCVIIPGHGIITHGTVSIEQAFVTFSSVCFSCFVKFFSDWLSSAKTGNIPDDKRRAVFDRAANALDPPARFDGGLSSGPFESENDIIRAMDEAGRATVEKRLVDSYFGNISYRNETTLYISQTGSSLDALSGCVDPCPLDGSSCAPITASSELSAHLDIVKRTGARAVLHGHPKFSVILSMDCDIACDSNTQCHKQCPQTRLFQDTPIVSGEVGTGPYGLCNTVPKAMEKNGGVIVYGHGVFTVGQTDFNEPFRKLVEIETACRNEYFEKIRLLMK